MSQQSPDGILEPELDTIDIVRAILAQTGTLSRLMEIHYLVQEPGVLDAVRYVAGLPDGDRARLLGFLTAQGSPSQLHVREVEPGVLHLEYEKKSHLRRMAPGVLTGCS